MKTYLVQFKETAVYSTAVEASSYTEAIAKAKEFDTLGHPEKGSVTARNTFKVVRELDDTEIEAWKDL